MVNTTKLAHTKRHKVTSSFAVENGGEHGHDPRCATVAMT
jgi:hypothetical protein